MSEHAAVQGRQSSYWASVTLTRPSVHRDVRHGRSTLQARTDGRHVPGIPRSAPASVAVVVRALRLADGASMGVAAAGVSVVVAAVRDLEPLSSLLVMLILVGLAVPAWLAALLAARAYEPRYLFAGSAEVHRVSIAAAGAGLTICSLGWLTLDPVYGPVMIGGLAATLLFTLCGRWVIRMRVQRANRSGAVRTRVLVVGDRDASASLVARLRRNLYHGWAVVGNIGHAERVPGDEDGRRRVLADILDAADRADAGLVLLTPEASAGLGSVADLQRALHDCGRDLALAPPMVEAIGPRVSVESVCGLPVVRISVSESHGPRRAVKAVADRAAAAAAIVVLLPLLAGIAAAIRLSSPGPALFRQHRVGRDVYLFTIWKFRTMYLDADARQVAVDGHNEGSGPLFKMRTDPRVTPLGRWLRRTSLDELPQLFNVLLGHMSIVGPRPALPREVAQYDDVTRRRLRVRPGITGLWQIHGRSDLSWDETKRLDVRYVENWSLGFDLSIIVRTVDAVFRGRGAY